MRTKELARLFRATSNEKRIRIVKALKSDMTINKLADHTGLPYKTVERHLKILVLVDLVKQNRQGLEVNFKLNKGSKNDFINTIVRLINAAK